MYEYMRYDSSGHKGQARSGKFKQVKKWCSFLCIVSENIVCLVGHVFSSCKSKPKTKKSYIVLLFLYLLNKLKKIFINLVYNNLNRKKNNI